MRFLPPCSLFVYQDHANFRRLSEREMSPIYTKETRGYLAITRTIEDDGRSRATRTCAPSRYALKTISLYPFAMNAETGEKEERETNVNHGGTARKIRDSSRGQRITRHKSRMGLRRETTGSG